MNATDTIYRVAHKPDPWVPLDWRWAEPDGTFGNRFDDANARFRVLYASSQLLGCFLETLARFRVDTTLLAELQEIAGPNDFQPFGVVPSEWLSNRIIGVATSNADFADICSTAWIARIRPLIARHLTTLGFDDFDAATLQQTRNRKVTQLTSAIVYELGAEGIYYRSKYGHNVDNWAIFEPFHLNPVRTYPITSSNPELQQALEIHGLELERR